MKRIAILTSGNQWFVPYAQKLHEQIPGSELFFDHKEIDASFNVVFILSYHKIIEENYLKKHNHNIVVHESDLPEGKGWAPMFWQILEGKNNIIFSMFEASNGVDDGDIYLQKTLRLTGYELNKELRKKQGNLTIDMCHDFLKIDTPSVVKKSQIGNESFYKKRTSEDSQLNINKSIKEQFNLLRIVDNDNYPAFFEVGGHKYRLKIEEVPNENR